MIYWAPFLHFYQPSFQFHRVLKRIADESYRPLLKVLQHHPLAKVTVNINGILAELLDEHGGHDIIRGFKRLSETGKAEFVESAKFHPILPLIPLQEAERQIRLNNETNRHFFGETYRPRGFFPPEMCYSAAVGKMIKMMGYEWVIASGIAHPETWPFDFISAVGRNDALRVLYRDDIVSNKISFKQLDGAAFVRELLWLAGDKKDMYVVTAMDAETFGHHIRDWETAFLAKVLDIVEALQASERGHKPVPAKYRDLFGDKEIPAIRIVTVSELIQKFPSKVSKPPLPSSWSTTSEDLSAGNYYPLWKHADNRIHDLQWEHLNLCCELVRIAESTQDAATPKESRELAVIGRTVLDKALTSCQFWWANRSRGLWSINLIHKGLLLQEETMLNAYKAISFSHATGDVKKDAHYKAMICRRIANNIKDMLINT